MSPDSAPSSAAPSNSPKPAQAILRELVQSSILLWEEWEALPEPVRDDLLGLPSKDALLDHLLADPLAQHVSGRDVRDAEALLQHLCLRTLSRTWGAE